MVAVVDKPAADLFLSHGFGGDGVAIDGTESYCSSLACRLSRLRVVTGAYRDGSPQKVVLCRGTTGKSAGPVQPQRFALFMRKLELRMMSVYDR